MMEVRERSLGWDANMTEIARMDELKQELEEELLEPSNEPRDSASSSSELSEGEACLRH